MIPYLLFVYSFYSFISFMGDKKSYSYQMNTMNEKFKTQADIETLAQEVACLKTLVTYMLKALGQADAGRVILNIERAISEVADEQQAETFRNTLNQIKTAYRQ